MKTSTTRPSEPKPTASAGKSSDKSVQSGRRSEDQPLKNKPEQRSRDETPTAKNQTERSPRQENL